MGCRWSKPHLLMSRGPHYTVGRTRSKTEYRQPSVTAGMRLPGVHETEFGDRKEMALNAVRTIRSTTQARNPAHTNTATKREIKYIVRSLVCRFSIPVNAVNKQHAPNVKLCSLEPDFMRRYRLRVRTERSTMASK